MPQLLDKKGLTEDEFLRQYNADKYPKPSVTADIVVFREHGGTPEVLLIRRGGHPFLGRWALPGGFANKNEPLESTAARELREETGVAGADLTLVGVYSAPGRDPRGWTVSAAFAAKVPYDTRAEAGDDAADLRWVPLTVSSDGLLHPDVPEPLAFDHGEILADAIRAVFGDTL